MHRRLAAVLSATALVITLPAGGAVASIQPEELDKAIDEAAGQGTAPDRPRDQPTRQELDQAASALVADGAIGVTARVDSPGFEWGGAAGVRERDESAPAQPQDRFRAGSITKPMVATLVLQEVEAGTFSLETPVNQLVPELFPDQPDITVEHLLSHRSGAQTGTDALLLTRVEDPESWEQFFDAVGQDYTEAEHLSTVNAVPWLFEPGAGFSYSNAGYIALGVVLEEVTGQGLEELLEDRVFGPAGMRHTSYPDEPGTRGPFLVGAGWTGEADDGGIGWVSLEGFDPDIFGAAGAVVSTTEDLNRFTEALLTGELVDPDLVEDMVVPRSSGLIEYGLGIYRVPDPCTGPGEPPEWLYGHDGATYGTTAIALTSADGSRQVSLGATGRDLISHVPSYDLAGLFEPMLQATCES